MIHSLLENSSYIFNPFAVPTLVVAGLIFVLGVFVLIWERYTRVSVMFFLMTVAVTWWQFSFSMMYLSVSDGLILWWAKSAYLTIAIIPCIIFHFTALVLQIYPRVKRQLWVYWPISIFFSLLIINSDMIITGFYRFWWGPYPQYGWMSIPYLLFFFSVMAAAMYYYVVEYKNSKKGTNHRYRIQMFMTAFAIGYIAVFDYIATYGIPIYPFGYIAVFGFIVLAARGVWRYHLVDITPALASEQIILTMADALLVFDRDGVIHVTNEAACRLFELQKTEMIGQSMSTIGNGFFSNEKIDQLVQNRFTKNVEMRLTTRNGRSVILECSISTIQDRWHTVALVCIARDVTERRLAEMALRESEAKFRAVADTATCSIFIYQGTKFIYANPATEKISGYSNEEIIIQLNFWDFVHPDHREMVKERGLARQRGENVPPKYELKIFTKQGESRWLDISVGVIDYGGLKAGLGVAFDITERKRAEEELKKSEERYRTLFETNPEPMWVYDAHTLAFLAVNNAAIYYYGYSREEFMHMTIKDIHVPGETSVFLDHVSLEQPQAHRGEVCRHLKKDGKVIDVEMTFHPIIFKDQNAQLVVAIDITERLRKEEERKKLEQQLFQSQKMESLGRLAGGIAHDMNNMLTVILPTAQLLQLSANDPDEVKRSAEIISNSTRRASEMVKQLLVFSRQTQLNIRSVQLNELINETTKMLGRILEKNIRIQMQLEEKIQPIDGDTTQIQQVLMNLCVNARDAMPDGGVLTIATRGVELNELFCQHHNIKPGQYVELVVADTGVGIPEDIQPKIFEAFFSTKDIGRGTGLGLAVVKSIVANHGGWINMQSTAGHGTTFSIYWPAALPHGNGEHEPKVESRLNGTESILIVDDEAYVREVYQKILAPLGYNITTAADSTQALEYYRKMDFDVAIIDIQMPGVDGRETLRRLRHIHSKAKPIFATGYLNPLLHQGDEFKEVPVLFKPFTIEQLVKTLRLALHDHSANAH